MFITRRANQKLERTIGRILQHKYTRRVYETDGTLDDNEQPIYELGDPTTNVKCTFLWNEEEHIDERGTILETVPILYVLPSDIISRGDIVQNVTDTKGNILLKSAKVSLINPTAEYGGSLLKLCRLEGAQI